MPHFTNKDQCNLSVLPFFHDFFTFQEYPVFTGWRDDVYVPIFTSSLILFKNSIMKQLLFLSILIVFAGTAVQAQIKTRVEKTKLQVPVKVIEPVPTEPKTAPSAPAPTTKTSGTTNTTTPVYV